MAVPALLWVAVAVFIGMSLPIELHSDDVGIMDVVSRSSWLEVWTTPFKALFYRPITVSIVKLSHGAFGATALPLHLLQGMLIVGIVGLFVATTDTRDRPMARAVGTLCLLASPMTFVAVSPFAVGVADTLVAIALVVSVAVITHPRFEMRGWRAGSRFSQRITTRRVAVESPEEPAQDAAAGGCRRRENTGPLLGLLAVSLFALLCKESGLLVPAFVAMALILRRRFAPAAAFIALALVYLVVRSQLVHSHDVAFATGFGTELLARDELRARFHDQWATLYGYNVLANLSSMLVYVPERGRFRFTSSTLFAATVFSATTWVWLRHFWARSDRLAQLPLVAIIGLNALLGYSYVRTRVMFVAAVAVALLVAPAIDDLWSREQRVAGQSGRVVAAALLAAWVVVWLWSIGRLHLQATT